MLTVPADTPVTMPDVMPTVATVVLELLHVPPVTESVSVIVDPAHTVPGPDIEGTDETVITLETVQPPTE